MSVGRGASRPGDVRDQGHDGRGLVLGQTVVHGLDHELVARLRGQVLTALSAERRRRLDGAAPVLTRADERQLGRSMITRALSEHRHAQLGAGVPMPDVEVDRATTEAVQASLFGLGALAPLIDDLSLSEININGCDEVWLTRDDGSKELGAPVASSDEELVEWVRTMATYGGLTSRAWDMANPQVEIRLPDGSRLVGIMGVVDRPAISIRLKRRPEVVLDDLRVLGDFDAGLQAFLRVLVRSQQNLLISGETGSAKTTLLRALSREIGSHERIITVEHFRELGLDEQREHHPDAVALEERLPNAEGEGAVTMRKLVQVARRMNPDRLIVGEVVGGEIVALLEAMTQGNDGGLTTIHAKSARAVPERIATYASSEGVAIESAFLFTASAVDFIVHMARRRNRDGTLTRYVQSVVEVLGFDGVQVVMSEVYAAAPGTTRAQPAAQISQGRATKLEQFGWVPAQHAGGTRGGLL